MMTESQNAKDTTGLNLSQLVRELTDVGGSDGDMDNFDHVSYIIKQIFENAKESQFNDALATYISRKNTEIEKVCSLHYQEFVQSIDQLLKVREGTLSLRGKIIDMNDQVQATGNKLVEKKKEVIETRRTLLNVEYALESMQSCLFILDMANKVQSRIENRKYYSALKLLDSLEEKHLKTMAEFSFVKKMIESIPVTQEVIRTAVLREMRDWFLVIKEQTSKVGKYAMSLTVKKNERAQENLDTSAEDVNQEDEDNVSQYSQELILETDTLIDFTPLHQCLHIHDTLGKRNLLKLIYDENRRLQADSHLKKTFTFHGDDLQPFELYIENIAGFFIVEAIVMESTRDFRSRYHVESLWDLASTKLIQVITESLHDCDNPDLFLGIKLTVVSFIQTMEVYGYSVASLIDLMVSLLDTYAKLMKLQCSDKLIELVEEDDYVPMTVHDQKEYDEVKLAYSLLGQDQKQPTAEAGHYRGRGAHMAKSLEFPLQLPFSRSFPKMCALIRSFINSFFVFAEGFSQQSNEMDDLLKKSLENIIGQTFNGTLTRMIGKGGLNLAIQVILNLPYLEKAGVMFEDLLMEHKNAKSARISLQASNAFDDIRAAAERRIHELICRKIDDFLDMSDYDWVTLQSSSKYSPYLLDLSSYLKTLGTTALASLPPNMVPSMYRESFEYLARRMLAMLQGPAIKKITFQFITQYQADVIYLDRFVNEFEFLKEEEIFSELKQLVDFLLLDNFETFLDPLIRSRRFSKLRSQNLAIVLEKFRGDTSYFSKLSAEEKAKSRTIENFIKQLKTQSTLTSNLSK